MMHLNPRPLRRIASIFITISPLTIIACGSGNQPAESPTDHSGQSHDVHSSENGEKSSPVEPTESTDVPSDAGKSNVAAADNSAANLPRAERPTPLSEAEQKETAKKCKPIMDALARATKGGGTKAENLEAVLQKPPKMPSSDLDLCKDRLRRGFRGYLFAALETEARVILQRFGLGMVKAYQTNGELCPAADPVPRDPQKVAAGPYVPTEADWDSAGWKCLSFSMPDQPMRFQYEVKSDRKAGTFEMIARGSPEKDGKFIVIVSKGAVKDGKIEISAPMAQ